jgi:pimeloyl-ACP methyl ester carboxylesterase
VGSNVSGGVAAGCGHWIPEEKPEWVAARMVEFYLGVANRS